MKKREWTDPEIERLKILYPDTRTQTVADELGCAVSRIYCKASELGLKKSAEFMASPECGRLQPGKNVGASSQFQPGLIPWNKGKKFDSGGRSVETRFKPGQMPHTWNPIGTERITRDGYLERKMTDTGITRRDYVPVHRLVWEAQHGKVPAGHAIAFVDGDKRNIEIGNLECISRAELMRRNTIHNYPKEIAELVQLRGALTRQINKREGKSA